MGQQLSTASADAIWGRLRKAYEPFHHTVLRRARLPKLQRIGLSGAKIRTLRAIVEAVEKGAIDFDALVDMPADEAHAMLTARARNRAVDRRPLSPLLPRPSGRLAGG